MTWVIALPWNRMTWTKVQRQPSVSACWQYGETSLTEFQRVTCLSTVHTNNCRSFSSQLWEYNAQDCLYDLCKMMRKQVTSATHAANSMNYQYMRLTVLNDIMQLKIIRYRVTYCVQLLCTIFRDLNAQLLSTTGNNYSNHHCNTAFVSQQTPCPTIVRCTFYID